MKTSFTGIVSGRVQMVMYRDFAQRKASGLGLAGTVRNISDGTVEVVAEGEKDVLEKYLELLRQGPALARVDDVQVEWQEPTGKYAGFSIVY